MNGEVTLLIADDDPSQLMLSEAALAGAGFMVHTVADGADAVERFEALKPDMVVLDVNMPRMSGIDACRQIRQRAGGRALPILMLTGRNDLPAISDAFAAGASDFAQKGINPRLLVERVRFLLRDHELQEELRGSRSKLLLAQRIARVGHWELGVEGRTLHVSPMLGEILGVDPQALASFEDFVAMLAPDERFAVRQGFVTCSTAGGRCSFDHRLSTAAGNEICVHLEAEFVADAGGPEAGTVIVTLQDLTRLHRAEEAVRMLSYTDVATGLPNRRQLAEQVAAALAVPANVATGVLAFRIHNFDQVAQAQGLEAANALMARMAGRIERELEAVSNGASIPWRTSAAAVSRTADAELALLLRSRDSSGHLTEVARGMLNALVGSASDEETACRPAVSAGIALATPDLSGAEQLLQRAHAAAEQASTPWSFEAYSPLPQARTRRRLQLESGLKAALDRGDVSLTFQPRVAAGGYELVGVECITRWEHPQLGLVPPDELVAVAESTGLGDAMGRWVLGEACRQVAVWHKQFEREFFVSLNLSARQLRDPGLPDAVRAALEKYGLEPKLLEVEVTESGLVEFPAETRAALEKLRRMGVRVALDDFGTGHSSLGGIRRLPLDCMKLDRSLMADLYTDLGAQGVTTAVIAMARSLRIRSVAQGIEDGAMLEMVEALGCDELQGHHVCPPVGPREFESWLEDGGAAALARNGALEVIDALEAVERRARTP